MHQKGQTLVDHYVKLITDHIEEIKALTPYLVVDGYFMKKEFIKPLLKQDLHILAKARWDANLQYVYKGRQKATGRKRVRDGKIDTTNVD
ncbi:hypothetical protein V9K67_26025 [Paraflavisolibacter sp. H34]|uniref:hypothetical protein n=1 Tax=Huijunlia imazamoxiresistens TaxID=3127457 RepID=UPI00301690C8